METAALGRWERREDLKGLCADLDALVRISTCLSSAEMPAAFQARRRIDRLVTDELEELSRTAQGYLASEGNAECHLKDLAVKPVHLGSISDDLPQFKEAVERAILARSVQRMLDRMPELPQLLSLNGSASAHVVERTVREVGSHLDGAVKEH
eukprot:gene30270-37812_t